VNFNEPTVHQRIKFQHSRTIHGSVTIDDSTKFTGSFLRNSFVMLNEQNAIECLAARNMRGMSVRGIVRDRNDCEMSGGSLTGENVILGKSAEGPG